MVSLSVLSIVITSNYLFKLSPFSISFDISFRRFSTLVRFPLSNYVGIETFLTEDVVLD